MLSLIVSGFNFIAEISLSRFFIQQFQRLARRFVRQIERAVMHRHERFRFCVNESLRCVRGEL
jgi:tRNA uridine 5-carbamoylmethylation protein Kti12